MVKLSSGNSPAWPLRNCSSIPYILIHIWNIFLMIISGFVDGVTVVADNLNVWSVIWSKMYLL